MILVLPSPPEPRIRHKTPEILARARMRFKSTSNHARDIVRMRRLIMVEGQRAFARLLKEYFEQRIEQLAIRMQSRRGQLSAPDVMVKSPVHLDFGGNEEAWQRALNEVFGTQASIELIADYVPTMQSIAARSYAQTSIIIGEEQAHDASVTILRRAQNLGQQITGINDTVKADLGRMIRKGIDDGKTTAEVARDIRDNVPQIAARRIPTIARTEVGRAIDEGTKQALKESATVTHISVIGCQAREKGSPTYRGESTCNIVDVPVSDVDQLFFHPNHTGCIVPSRFVGGR